MPSSFADCRLLRASPCSQTRYGKRERTAAVLLRELRLVLVNSCSISTTERSGACRSRCSLGSRELSERRTAYVRPTRGSRLCDTSRLCGVTSKVPLSGHCLAIKAKSSRELRGAATAKSARSGKQPISAEHGLPITSDKDVEASFSGRDDDQGLEAGVIPESRLHADDPFSSSAQASTSGRPRIAVATATQGTVLFPPAQRSQIRDSWFAIADPALAHSELRVAACTVHFTAEFQVSQPTKSQSYRKHLMRWSKIFKRNGERGATALDRAEKVVVFGGGSFGTAMGAVLARQKADLRVTLLLRDPYICSDINERHTNTRYLKEHILPSNVFATTSMVEAIEGAQYAVHAVPVQHSRAFLASMKELLAPDVPIISVSKGLELGTGKMMSELIPQALGRRQPAAFLSGPSFAKEVMDLRPTGIVAASKDANLAKEMQELFASPYLRVNNTSDVTGVEICGALKNVLAIAAGIVEGLDLGHNAMAALVTQGCAEIRWLAEKMGAKQATVAGLSGLGDIMLTCYGSLSRNRSVGVRLGQGERLEDILSSSKQVAEGVSTAGVVVGLARKYRVNLPVLTAVAHILNSDLTPKHAVAEIMNLPQIEER